jgi:hypothetical protein
MFPRSLAWTALVVFPVAALAQGVDEEYTKKIREYTVDPAFLTELVDHLPASDKVPTPLKVLGYVAGAPDRLTYAKDVHRYFRALAQATPRVQVWSMGHSEEGREMILVAVSAEANMKNLDRLREITARLADPRKTPPPQARELLAEGKPIYWLTGAMHSPETGSPEMLMELAYRLAVEDTPLVKAIRDNTVVLITPVLEVDGRERVVDLYRYKKENPARTPPPLVYWGHYVAHDNNRDAIGLALKLSQHVMAKALKWYPTVLHDLHESVPFLYISTGTGPYNAWLDPIVVDEWHQLAYHEIGELTRRGVPGVWTHGFYDGWAPNYMFYIANGHNSIGRFYETFGNGGADTRERTVRGQSDRAWYRPNPPLPKVKWSHRNNVNLQQSGLLLALKYVADHRQEFLQNFYLKARRSVAKATTEGPAAYVIPADEPRRAAVSDLVALFRMQGVETHRAAAAFKVKEKVRGDKGKEEEKEVEFGEGSYVIRMDQPYSRLADMLLDTQYYNVNDPRPYDDTGWTLGALHNIKTVRVMDVGILKVPMSDAAAPQAILREQLSPGNVLLIANRAESQLATFRFLLKDIAMEAAESPFEAASRKFAAGSLIVRASSEDTRERLTTYAIRMGLDVRAVETAPEVKRHKVGVPRVAMVHDWMSTQDEGWWRIVFDRYNVPYEYVSVHAIRNTAGLRSRWDVLVFAPIRTPLPRFLNGIQAADVIPWEPSEKYPNLGGPDKAEDIRGGIGYEGLAHLRRFAEEGGLILAAPSTSALVVQAGLVEAVAVEQARGLRAQGGVYRVNVTDAGSPIAYGYGDTLAVYFNQSPLFAAGLSTVLTGRGGGGDGATGGRVTGRGGPKDPDVPQGRPYVAPPEPPKPPQTLADVPEEQLNFVRHLLPPQERLPRIVLKFAKKDDLGISGMLDKPEELAERPAIIDCPVGKGHVVLFAHNPMWRYETHGSHALVFNAILHWDHLGTGRSQALGAEKKQGPKRGQ